MQRFDIRCYKQDLRNRHKEQRREMSPEQKEACDTEILRRLRALWHFSSADVLLTYVSTPLEIDTRRIIELTLSEGRRVAVPYCIDGTREMRFYCIRSFNELNRRTFGVLEPNPERCEELSEFKSSVCLVPGLAFDREGYRLGYGKGYYDRFLSRYDGVMLGLCYASGITRRLHRGRYDIPCDFVITDHEVIDCKKQRP